MAKLQVKVRKSLQDTRRVLKEGLKELEKFQLAQETKWPNGSSYSLRNPKVRETCAGEYPDHVSIYGVHGSKVIYLYTALQKLDNLLESCD